MISSAQAADWQKYANGRFGVVIDVPPNFVQWGDVPANNDGLTFVSSDGVAKLLVWGNNIVAESFKAELQGNFENDQTDGWAVSYGASNKQKKMTWAVYSGTKDTMIMYEKSIASCKGTQSLHFRIVYPLAQKKAYDAVVTRLGKSMKAGPATDC
jgi:uncharacterized protein (UPF0333 family)